MNDYLIEYSYTKEDHRILEKIPVHAPNIQYAVDSVKKALNYLPELRIERAWIERNNRWEERDWDI